MATAGCVTLCEKFEEIVEGKKEKYSSFIDKYTNCFYERDIKSLEEMYAHDGDIVYFDNHRDCDSYDLKSHIDKVKKFLENGRIERLSYEIIRAYENGDVTCLLVKFKYPSNPVPSVRTTFYLVSGKSEYRIRHIHYSFDPNEV